MINWDMVGALSTIVTGAVALFALLMSLNPEWIADKKLLNRVQRNRKLKDVCLSIILSRCGILVVESDLASCIKVEYRIEQLGWIQKTHLRVSQDYHPELIALESAGIVGRVEQQRVQQLSLNAFNGYQLTGEGNRFFDKAEKHLLKNFPLFEKPELADNFETTDPNLLRLINNVFLDNYHLAKVKSLQSEILLSAFPNLSIDHPIVSVMFIPVTQVKDNEFAIAFFPGHGNGFEKGMPLSLKPIDRPVNLGEMQFSNLEGSVDTTVVSTAERTDENGQCFTQVGLCYTNEVLNA